MNANIEIRAPLKHLLNAYQDDIKSITDFYGAMENGQHRHAVRLIENAARKKNGGHGSNLLSIELDYVQKVLDSQYWSKAFTQFGIDELLSAEKRDSWRKDIRELNVPTFVDTNVIPTLEDTLLKRGQLLAEKIDGVYQRLSRAHKTNDHNGFYKRMIFYMPEYSSYSTIMTEAISDLIQVCAHLLGRDMDFKEGYDFSIWVEYYQPKDGSWYWIAGNILRARRYLKGTVHIEVHPDLAWQLNKLLADYGSNRFAIAPEFTKQRKESKVKAPKLKDWFLQPETIRMLSSAVCSYNEIDLRSHNSNAEVRALLASIGGVQQSSSVFSFDYDTTNVVEQIVKHGAIPEYKSYQFYPTPAELAQELIKRADISEGHTVLEPSAGNGNLVILAEQISAQVTAVELSSLRCEILRSRTKADVHQADFMRWRNPHGYDRIVMNPPFTGGQVSAHITRAAMMLNPKGKLVSIVPAGFRADIGIAYTLSNEINNEFDNTSISVRILEANKE